MPTKKQKAKKVFKKFVEGTKQAYTGGKKFAQEYAPRAHKFTRATAEAIAAGVQPPIRKFNPQEVQMIRAAMRKGKYLDLTQLPRKPKKKELIADIIHKRAPKINPIVRGPRKNLDF